MKPKFRSLIAAFAPLSRSSLIVCASLCAATSVHADQTWTGISSDGLWATTGNWSGAALPTATDAAVFNASSLTNLTIDTGANRSIYGISLGSPAGAVTLNSNTLTIGKGGIDMSTATQNLTINSTVAAADGGRQLWNVNTGRTLTLAAAPTKGSNAACPIQVSTSGATIFGAATANLLLDTQNNPFVTLGENNWAGTSAGTVVASTYTDATTALVAGVVNDIKANLTGTNPTDVSAIRFNETTAYDVTVSNSGTARTMTARGILVTANSVGGSIGANLRNNGFVRPNRVSASPSFNIIQNSASDFTIGANLSNASSSTAVRLVKSGTGKLISLQDNGYSGGTFIGEGTLQFGNGSAVSGFAGYGFPGGGDIVNNGSLVMNRASDVTLVHNISGTGSLSQAGPGTLNLTTSVSTFTGPVNITGGTLAVTTMANLGSGTDININNGTFKFLGVIDPSARTITIGSSGATFDTNGNAITLANAFATGSTGSLTKTGAGSLTLDAANDYSGGTTVNSGVLIANAALTGAVTVNNGGSLGGTGNIAGAVTIGSGANLAPGSSVGTLTVGSLNLNAGSTATYEFSNAPANDQTVVTTSGGLTINGGAITVYQEGTTTPFTTPGTYDLITYTGAITGSVSSLSVANQQAGFTYTFNATGTKVTLKIEAAGVVSHWLTDGNGNWPVGTNWTAGTVPSGSGQTAIFDKALTADFATVSMDGSKTLGAITFTTNAFGYIIAPGTGGTLTLNNGALAATIVNNDGNHEISAPISLVSNTGLTSLAADDGLILSGVVSGAGTLTKTGPGSLSLLGANNFNGLLTLNGGATTFALNGLGAGNLTISGASLIWDAATSNTQDISNRTITFGSDPVLFDTNGNDVALANSIGNGGAATFTKAGLGKLTLGADATFTGGVTISDGVLQLGTGGATGLVSGAITNNAELIVDLSTGSTFSNLVSGTGSFAHSGTGSLTLGAQNTFSGTTTIYESTGSLILSDALNLQNSTLDYQATGGALSFGTLTAATLGGLSGDRNLTLNNTTPAAVALSIGGNNQATTYSGILSGAGSLIKSGTNTSTLTGLNTYTGATTVNGGTLDLWGGAIAGGSLNVTGSGKMQISSSSFSATNGAIATASNGMRLDGGTATFSGALVANCTSSNGNAALIKVTDGTLTAPSITLGRTGQNVSAEPAAAAADTNLYITGGAVNVAGNLNVGTADGNSNSTVITRIDGGTLTVGGALTVGLNNGGRWSILDVNGGDLSSTDAVSGIVLGGPFAGKTAFLVRSGTATAERIQLGQGALGGVGLINISGGALYVGTGGIVLGTTEPLFSSEIRLSGGTLAAKAAWGTSLPVNVTLPSIIKASDAADVARNISISGVVAGTGDLEKTGAGALTLSANNTYTGATTVTEGSLLVTGNSSAATGAVTVASGATLGGNGNIGGDVTIESGAHHALAVAATPGAQVIRVISGTLTLTAGNILDLSAAVAPAAGVYTLATASSISGTPTTINYSGLTGTVTVVGGNTLQLTVTGGSGYDSWKGANAGGQASNLDWDLDGVSNGVEYFMGAAPGFTANPSVVVTAGPVRKVTWPKSATFSGTYIVQTSSNLTTWTTESSGIVDSGTSVEYTLPTGAGKLFVRLVVTPSN